VPENVPILPANNGPENPEREEFVRRTWIAVLIVFGVVAFALVFWRATNIFLMAFAGALLAIFLRSLANIVHRFTRMKPHLAVLLVLVVLLALFAGMCWLVAAPASEQFDQLTQQVPSAIGKLQQQLMETRAGKMVLERIGVATAQTSSVTQHIGNFFSLTIEGVVGVLVIAFCGMFFALDPDLYIGGFLLLFPRWKRDRTRAIVYELGVNLQHWLLGQVIAMTIIGVLTWVGLMIIGVPLAGVLGLIAGVLDFIPVVGPWIAGILAALLAVVQDPMKAVWVAVLFVVLHLFEGHVLIPQVQKYATKLPPVLTILALALFAKIFGFMGLLVATPLLVVVLILVKTMYREDVLQRTGAD
jgi:predicted PurR-regulated permease PerM